VAACLKAYHDSNPFSAALNVKTLQDYYHQAFAYLKDQHQIQVEETADKKTVDRVIQKVSCTALP